MTSLQDDKILIELALKKDRAAYEALFNKYQHLAYTLAMKFSNNDVELSKEITQDSFLKAFQNLSSFKNQSKFGTWLYSIVFTTAMDACNKPVKSIKLQYVEDLDEDLEENDNTDYNSDLKFERQHIAEEIHMALQRLPEVDKAVLTLYYLHEESIEDIAYIMKADRNAVKVRLFRARKKLKDHLSTNIKK